MSVEELKLQIITKITSIEDQIILEEILRLITKEQAVTELYELTDDERRAVQEGLDDVRDGRLHSSIVAENMIKEWLKK
ncbi:MAG TPA: hypothetical protein VGD40_00360 [Chryseosolibacter sp.]